MRRSKLVKNIRLLKTISQTFGLRFRYLFLFTFNTLLGWLNSFFFLLDRIFFPGLRRNATEQPIYMIGHLRSGTTFLHRFLSEYCQELRTFFLWEMITPPLLLKKVLSPFLPLLGKISLNKVYDPSIHETGMDKEETDDIALYFRFLDGMLSWIYFHAWQKFDSSAALRSSVMEINNQSHFVDYLNQVYRILSYQSGKRIFSKSFSGLFYFEEMLENTPDAKIIILIRDPVEAIPSLMSLEESVQKKMHGKIRMQENRDQYLKNLYQLSLFYYLRLEETYQKYKDHPNFLFIEYSEMKNSFKPVMHKLIRHCGLAETDKLVEAISRQAKTQESYSSSHRYDLERFNLDEDSIRKDTPFYLKFVNERE